MESDSLVQKWTGRQTSWFTKVDRASKWTGRQTSGSMDRAPDFLVQIVNRASDFLVHFPVQETGGPQPLFPGCSPPVLFHYFSIYTKDAVIRVSAKRYISMPGFPLDPRDPVRWARYQRPLPVQGRSISDPEVSDRKILRTTCRS